MCSPNFMQIGWKTTEREDKYKVLIFNYNENELLVFNYIENEQLVLDNDIVKYEQLKFMYWILV